MKGGTCLRQVNMQTQEVRSVVDLSLVYKSKDLAAGASIEYEPGRCTNNNSTPPIAHLTGASHFNSLASLLSRAEGCVRVSVCFL